MGVAYMKWSYMYVAQVHGVGDCQPCTQAPPHAEKKGRELKDLITCTMM